MIIMMHDDGDADIEIYLSFLFYAHDYFCV